MQCFLRLLVVICAGLAGLYALPAEARRVALVIGNSEYQHTRVLPNPRNDAEAIAKLLRDIGFADVALKTDLAYRAMREELRAFAGKAGDADVAIVYYAGHGIEVAGENYLVPTDAKLARDLDLEYEAITLASVLNAVSDARKLKLVILDACRNNPLGDKLALRAGVTREVSRGLVRIESKGDVLVAYSAKAGTVAQDGKGKHSPYAEALLQHMPTPGVDVLRMFGQVKEAVLGATDRKQEPWLYGSPGGEAIALVPGIVPPPPQSSEAAARDYDAAAKIGTKEAWDAFLAAHPAGFYAELAREQRAKAIASLHGAPTAPAAGPEGKRKSKTGAKYSIAEDIQCCVRVKLSEIKNPKSIHFGQSTLQVRSACAWIIRQGNKRWCEAWGLTGKR